ncbi:MAG: 5-bromo-4-chloroindolyl phosphate hydrolysis family protein [Thermomicrobiales bacterium]
MRQAEPEERTDSQTPGAPAVVPTHQVVGQSVRHLRDMGREISRALSSDDKVPLRQSSSPGDPSEEAARKHIRELRDFYVHLSIYVAVSAFLFILDVITGPGFWFYWPALGWGVGVAIHAVAVLTEDVAFDKRWEDRKVRERLNRQGPRPDPPSRSQEDGPTASTDMTSLVEDGIGRVAALRRTALSIENPAARAQTLRICAAADNILAALAEEGRETRLAREFLDQYLSPARTIVSQYARLSSRGVATARDALDRVETHDLPLIERRMDELYDRIHRGDVIDLQVASEMLELGLMEGGTSSKQS